MVSSLRRYSTHDRPECLAAFLSNIPAYFREHERADFETFLDTPDCPYFVVEVSGRIIGCGGYGVRKGSDVADLCWGMVAAEHHRVHLGEYLLLGRLQAIIINESVRGVRLATSQKTDGFFQKYGFVVQSRERDGIAEGLDNVEMSLELTADVRESILERWHAVRQRIEC